MKMFYLFSDQFVNDYEWTFSFILAIKCIRCNNFALIPIQSWTRLDIEKWIKTKNEKCLRISEFERLTLDVQFIFIKAYLH